MPFQNKVLKTYWTLSATDSPRRPFFVLHTYDASPRTKQGVAFRDEYRRLVCTKCGWFDPRKAARIGIARDVRCPFRTRDVVFSDDGRLVVSKRCRLAFERTGGMDVEFFPLPSDPDYDIAFSRRQLLPPKDSRLCKSDKDLWEMRLPFTIIGKCKSCGHYIDVSFDEEFLALSPRFVTGAVVLDRGGWYGYLEAFVVSDRVAKDLQKQKLKGLRLRKVEVDKDATAPMIRRLRKYANKNNKKG